MVHDESSALSINAANCTLITDYHALLLTSPMTTSSDETEQDLDTLKVSVKLSPDAAHSVQIIIVQANRILVLFLILRNYYNECKYFDKAHGLVTNF